MLMKILKNSKLEEMKPLIITEEVPFPLIDLHNLVLDIGRYPEFLPWFKMIKILERMDDNKVSDCVCGYLRADVKIGFGFITASYVCDINHELVFDKEDFSKALSSKINIASDSKIFKRMNSDWELSFIDSKTTMVKFSTCSLFESKILSKLLSTKIHKKSLEIINRFKKRAEFFAQSKKTWE